MPALEPHLTAMADRFYDQTARHLEAGKVFSGGEEQIARLKQTLMAWARGLLAGNYDENYATGRYRIGAQHVAVGLPQRYD